MKVAKFLYTCTLVALLPLVGVAQQQRIIQYQQVMPIINPSAMGESETVEVGIVGQYGLYGFDGGPKTVAMSTTIPFELKTHNTTSSRGGYRLQEGEESKNSFLGLTVAANQVGVHQAITAMASYAHKVKLGTETNLTLAFSAGATSRSSDYNSASSEFGYDPTLLQKAEGTPTKTSFAGQLGAMFSHKAVYLSAFSLLSKEVNAGYHVGIRSRREKGWNIDLSTMGRYEDKKYYQNFNLLMRYGKGLTLGASYRTQNDIALLGAIKISSITVGYAYQILNFDKLLPTHEVMIKYTLGNKKDEDEDGYYR
jgi:type IX secretion system PorP/SprF family membrane protein